MDRLDLPLDRKSARYLVRVSFLHNRPASTVGNCCGLRHACRYEWNDAVLPIRRQHPHDGAGNVRDHRACDRLHPGAHGILEDVLYLEIRTLVNFILACV